MKFISNLKRLAATVAIATLLFTATASADKGDDKASPAKAVPVAKAVASPKIRPLSVAVDLISKTQLKGTLTDTTQLDMQTSFGVANIPLSEVAGIKFASADDASTTVVMLNGDSITGATDVKLVTVETEWGIASINGSSIASILFVPGVTWNPQSGLNGQRWNLANLKKEQPNKAPAPNPAQRTQGSVNSNGQLVYPNNTAPRNFYQPR